MSDFPLRLSVLITAFTVAHSITLGLSALELVQLPQAPVEAVIVFTSKPRRRMKNISPITNRM